MNHSFDHKNKQRKQTILQTLIRVRFASIDQIVHLLWGQPRHQRQKKYFRQRAARVLEELRDEGLVESHRFASLDIQIADRPLFFWAPGEPDPHFSSYEVHRVRCPYDDLASTVVYMATRQTLRKLGDDGIELSSMTVGLAENATFNDCSHVPWVDQLSEPENPRNEVKKNLLYRHTGPDYIDGPPHPYQHHVGYIDHHLHVTELYLHLHTLKGFQLDPKDWVGAGILTDRNPGKGHDVVFLDDQVKPYLAIFYAGHFTRLEQVHEQCEASGVSYLYWANAKESSQIADRLKKAATTWGGEERLRQAAGHGPSGIEQILLSVLQSFPVLGKGDITWSLVKRELFGNHNPSPCEGDSFNCQRLADEVLKGLCEAGRIACLPNPKCVPFFCARRSNALFEWRPWDAAYQNAPRPEDLSAQLEERWTNEEMHPGIKW